MIGSYQIVWHLIDFWVNFDLRSFEFWTGHTLNQFFVLLFSLFGAATFRLCRSRRRCGGEDTPTCSTCRAKSPSTCRSSIAPRAPWTSPGCTCTNTSPCKKIAIAILDRVPHRCSPVVVESSERRKSRQWCNSLLRKSYF